MFACSGSSINDKIAFQRRPTTIKFKERNMVTIKDCEKDIHLC